MEEIPHTKRPDTEEPAIGARSFESRLSASLPRFRRFARALTRHVADADDLVQVALERALERQRQWRAESSLEGWMFGIIKNAWIDEVRRRRRGAALFAPEEAGALVGERSAESHAIALSVQQAMERLPNEQRLAVALVLIEGLSYTEAAAVMEVPIGTLTSRLARGRVALMEMLGP